MVSGRTQIRLKKATTVVSVELSVSNYKLAIEFAILAGFPLPHELQESCVVLNYSLTQDSHDKADKSEIWDRY